MEILYILLLAEETARDRSYGQSGFGVQEMYAPEQSSDHIWKYVKPLLYQSNGGAET